MLKYRLVQRANPRDASQPKKLYAMPVFNGCKTISQLGEDVTSSSSLSRGDLQNALMSIVDNVPKYLLDSNSVQLGEIGNLRITFSSQGVDSENDFDAAMIRDLKIVFTPGPRLKKILLQARFEKS